MDDKVQCTYTLELKSPLHFLALQKFGPKHIEYKGIAAFADVQGYYCHCRYTGC